MKKAKKDVECYECDLKFTITYKSKHLPQCCPFCGEGVTIVDERPFLKDFDEYDDFDDAEYFSEEDEFDEEDDE